MHQKLLRFLGGLVVLAWLTACTPSAPSDEVVEQKGQQFFTALKNDQFDQALDMYSKEFFAMRPREEWKALLQKLRKDLGPMQSFELKRKQSDLRYSGAFFIFEYSTMYGTEKAWETVTFFTPVNSEEVRVFGHHIKTKGLDTNPRN